MRADCFRVIAAGSHTIRFVLFISSGISLKNGWLAALLYLKGDARLPIKNVEIRNVTVGEVTKFVKNVVNAENVVEENIIYKEKQDKQ